MADYWVSNDRKFCDFCKCWIADNKPSIAFHEGGKKHKRNVAKRISEISHQSAKDEKAKQKFNQQIRQMEDAAMKAYSCDISNSADITSKAINALYTSTTGVAASVGGTSTRNTIETNGMRPGPAALPAHAIDPLLPPIDILEEEEKAKRERMMKKRLNPIKPWDTDVGCSETILWCEAKSDEGHTYYWNVKTGESIWTAPKEGYMTLEEYHRINKIAEAQQHARLAKESKFMRENADEIVAKYKREKLKNIIPKPSEKIVKKEKEEERDNYKTYEEPGWNAQPLGQWETVTETKSETKMDLQLPKINTEILYVPAANIPIEQPSVKKFKEKTVTSLGIDETYANVPNSFKKRKTAIKRNVRQRLDDD